MIQRYIEGNIKKYTLLNNKCFLVFSCDHISTVVVLLKLPCVVVLLKLPCVVVLLKLPCVDVLLKLPCVVVLLKLPFVDVSLSYPSILFFDLIVFEIFYFKMVSANRSCYSLPLSFL